MNERMKKLAEKCGIIGGDLYVDRVVDYEKFAELIVKECLELGKELQPQDITNGSDDYKSGREMGIEVFMNQIKKNFGVEE